MQFSSPTFLLAVLPVVFAGFVLVSRHGSHAMTKGWLAACSLALFAWWRPEAVPVLLASLIGNFALARRLGQTRSRRLLIAAVVLNCFYLGYFKYALFVVDNANAVFGAGWPAPHLLLLPLGISFYTFQQIAYLVDVQAGRVQPHGLLDQTLFMGFFPYVVSGPITHAGEMVPQFNDPSRLRPQLQTVCLGLTIFLIGMAKKVLVADPFAPTVARVFADAEHGGVGFVQAWAGALSFALEMYFDFSGYSDMAIGLALLFGIALPLNFNSPFKARNVIDYWSRWHMTLTRFLTAYIYNPVVLSLSRRRMARGLPLPRRGRMTPGAFATLVAGPTMLTMLVSGIWHGAGWQFVIFGLLHGAFLVIAHGWHAVKARLGLSFGGTYLGGHVAVAASVLLTFLCAVVALVFFRAGSVAAAMDIVSGMAGLNGLTLPPALAPLAAMLGGDVAPMDGLGGVQFARIALFLAVVWALPNTFEWLRHFPTALDFRACGQDGAIALPAWRPSPWIGAALGSLTLFVVLTSFSAAPAEFLYAKF